MVTEFDLLLNYGKEFEFLAYNTLPELTLACFGNDIWGCLLQTPVPWTYWKLKSPHLSTHAFFFFFLPEYFPQFASLYFKTKIKQHFLIMHSLTFSFPLYSRSILSLLAVVFMTLGIVCVHVYFSHFWGKVLIFCIVLEPKAVSAIGGTQKIYV